MKVEIYGDGDDRVEVEGDLNGEFEACNCAVFLHFGDGTILEVEYNPKSDIYWRIKIVKICDGTNFERLPGTYDGEDNMSCDRLRLTGDLKSVSCWGSAEGPTREDCESFFDALDTDDLTMDKMKRIMAIAREG